MATIIIVGIVCFMSGIMVGMVMTALMTNSKINAIYDEVMHTQVEQTKQRRGTEQ